MCFSKTPYSEVLSCNAAAPMFDGAKNNMTVPSAIFPDRAEPKVARYSVRKTYGRLLEKVEEAFSKKKPLFALPIYYPLAYYRGDDESIDPRSRTVRNKWLDSSRIMF